MRGLRPLAGCGLVLLCSAAAYAAAPVAVDQFHRAFSVKQVRIAQGGTIRFSNIDEFLHQLYVASSSFKFSSPEQPPGQVVDVTFPTKGTFEVRCEIHPKMVMSVTVE